MRDHHTKTKGNLAVLKIKADSYEKGWLPLQPESEHEPFDLVLYRNGHFYRTQVKYSKAKKGMISANLRASWADKHGTHSNRIDLSEIDLFAIYCPDTDTCYYIHTSQITTKCEINLRVEGDGNKFTVHAKQFERIPCESEISPSGSADQYIAPQAT